MKNNNYLKHALTAIILLFYSISFAQFINPPRAAPGATKTYTIDISSIQGGARDNFIVWILNGRHSGELIGDYVNMVNPQMIGTYGKSVTQKVKWTNNCEDLSKGHYWLNVFIVPNDNIYTFLSNLAGSGPYIGAANGLYTHQFVLGLTELRPSSSSCPDCDRYQNAIDSYIAGFYGTNPQGLINTYGFDPREPDTPYISEYSIRQTMYYAIETELQSSPRCPNLDDRGFTLNIPNRCENQIEIDKYIDGYNGDNPQFMKGFFGFDPYAPGGINSNQITIEQIHLTFSSYIWEITSSNDDLECRGASDRGFSTLNYCDRVQDWTANIVNDTSKAFDQKVQELSSRKAELIDCNSIDGFCKLLQDRIDSYITAYNGNNPQFMIDYFGYDPYAMGGVNSSKKTIKKIYEEFHNDISNIIANNMDCQPDDKGFLALNYCDRLDDWATTIFNDPSKTIMEKLMEINTRQAEIQGCSN